MDSGVIEIWFIEVEFYVKWRIEGIKRDCKVW